MRDQYPTIKAVVFDLDGLMLNTEDVFDLAGKELLARRGLKMTPEIHHSMLGRRPIEAFQAMKDLTGITETIDSLLHETQQLFAQFAENHLAVMPGLLDLLDHVECVQLPKAVATSSPRQYLTDLLGRFDLLDRFPVSLTAEDVRHGKPHPEIYETVAGLLSVDVQQMLVLEDSEAGTRSAASAGAFVVSIPNQHTLVGDFSMASMRVDSLAADALRQLLRPD